MVRGRPDTIKDVGDEYFYKASFEHDDPALCPSRPVVFYFENKPVPVMIRPHLGFVLGLIAGDSRLHIRSNACPYYAARIGGLIQRFTGLDLDIRSTKGTLKCVEDPTLQHVVIDDKLEAWVPGSNVTVIPALDYEWTGQRDTALLGLVPGLALVFDLPCIFQLAPLVKLVASYYSQPTAGCFRCGTFYSTNQACFRCALRADESSDSDPSSD
jgi:hypothetical protein